MSLSRRELEDFSPMVDKTVQKFLGFSEGTLATAAMNCITKGYDKRKTIEKLCIILDDGQATKFADKLFGAYDDFRAMSKQDRTKKRKKEMELEPGDEPSPVKVAKKFEEKVTVPEPGQPSPGQLTADKIKEMMASAHKLIQERKAQLNIVEKVSPTPPRPPRPAAPLPMFDTSAMAQQQVTEALLKARQAAELQQRIAASLAKAGIQAPPEVTAAAQPAFKTLSDGPTPLILDDQGRTIDAKTGETIQLTQHMPTLKANIRAKKREEFKVVLQHSHLKPAEEIQESSQFFDNRLGGKAAQRNRRSFKFHEQGKFQQLASKLRTKAQLEKLQTDISQAAKKTGIVTAAKLATIQNKTTVEGEIPDVEWWDGVVLKHGTYENVDNAAEDKDILDGVTHLVEHPTQMKPPGQINKEVTIPVMLTKRERKKLRRQSRLEAQKELQEKIRLGLLPPPEPKVRLANLMRVLGTEAVQDPTKVEAHVRAQMAKRIKDHEEANASRKLTKDQRREKKCKKIKEDTTHGVQVSVYRIHNFTNPAKKFKVEANANQLFMTGIVVLHKECNVVVVEGGPKQQRKFRRLMMHRIKWSEDQKSKYDTDGDEDKKVINTCQLVWEGSVKERAFIEMKFKACPTENFAREQFKKFGAEQYWDLAYSGAVLEAAGEEV